MDQEARDKLKLMEENVNQAGQATLEAWKLIENQHSSAATRSSLGSSSTSSSSHTPNPTTTGMKQPTTNKYAALISQPGSSQHQPLQIEIPRQIDRSDSRLPAFDWKKKHSSTTAVNADNYTAASTTLMMGEEDDLELPNHPVKKTYPSDRRIAAGNLFGIDCSGGITREPSNRTSIGSPVHQEETISTFTVRKADNVFSDKFGSKKGLMQLQVDTEQRTVTLLTVNDGREVYSCAAINARQGRSLLSLHMKIQKGNSTLTKKVNFFSEEDRSHFLRVLEFGKVMCGVTVQNTKRSLSRRQVEDDDVEEVEDDRADQRESNGELEGLQEGLEYDLDAMVQAEEELQKKKKKKKRKQKGSDRKKEDGFLIGEKIVEHVQRVTNLVILSQMERAVQGVMTITNYGISFVPYDVTWAFGSFSVPLATVMEVSRDGLVVLIDCKDLRTIRLSMHDAYTHKKDYDQPPSTPDQRWLNLIMLKMKPPNQIRQLFAFEYFAAKKKSQQNVDVEDSSTNGWMVYSPTAEYIRLGFLPNQQQQQQQQQLQQSNTMSNNSMASNLSRDVAAPLPSYAFSMNPNGRISRFSSTSVSSNSSSSLMSDYNNSLSFSSSFSASLSSCPPTPVASSGWRLLKNSRFLFSLTYPQLMIVPNNITEEQLVQSANFRSKARLPIATWRHPHTHAILVRSSQPCYGVAANRCEADRLLLRAYRDYASSKSKNSPNKLYIVDARKPIATKGNRLKGKGVENPQHYDGAVVEFLGIANIHKMRDSVEALKDLVSPESEESGQNKHFHTRLESTRWLKHIMRVLSGACRVAELLDEEGCSVLVHCSDGWDRTPQLVALAQLILDPYYRTIRGFAVLVEKEWCSFGHKFADRIRVGKDPSDQPHERSPVMLQFLDCVWQMTRQFPTGFEFNEKFLLHVVDSLVSGLYGTFLYNSERERTYEKAYEKTESVWTPILQETSKVYFNPLYKKTKRCLFPRASLKKIILWDGLYFRWDPECHPAWIKYVNHRSAARGHYEESESESNSEDSDGSVDQQQGHRVSVDKSFSSSDDEEQEDVAILKKQNREDEHQPIPQVGTIHRNRNRNQLLVDVDKEYDFLRRIQHEAAIRSRNRIAAQNTQNLLHSSNLKKTHIPNLLTLLKESTNREKELEELIRVFTHKYTQILEVEQQNYEEIMKVENIRQI